MQLNITRLSDEVKTNHLMLTIVNVREVKATNKDGSTRTQWIIDNREYPDLGLWVNKRDMVRLIAVYDSKETDDWKGKLLPCKRVTFTDKETKQEGTKFVPVGLDEWEPAIAAFHKQHGESRAASSGRKRGRTQ